jgi:hypothetical protein
MVTKTHTRARARGMRLSSETFVLRSYLHSHAFGEGCSFDITLSSTVLWSRFTTVSFAILRCTCDVLRFAIPHLSNHYILRGFSRSKHTKKEFFDRPRCQSTPGQLSGHSDDRPSFCFWARLPSFNLTALSEDIPCLQFLLPVAVFVQPRYQ